MKIFNLPISNFQTACQQKHPCDNAETLFPWSTTEIRRCCIRHTQTGLRARGLVSVSVEPGLIALPTAFKRRLRQIRFLDHRPTGTKAHVANIFLINCFTILSSSEWNAMTAKRPPLFQTACNLRQNCLYLFELAVNKDANCLEGARSRVLSALTSTDRFAPQAAPACGLYRWDSPRVAQQWRAQSGD